MSHCAAAWRRTTSFVSERRQTVSQRRTETKSCGKRYLNDSPLFQGLGNRAHKTNEK